MLSRGRCCCVIVFAIFLSTPAAYGIQLTDQWSRSLRDRNITILDWEGQIANPAVRLFVQAPINGKFPITIDLRANHPRLYFDLPSVVSATGPSKRIILSQPNEKQSFRLGIFPDRDYLAEHHQLTIRSTDAAGAADEFQVPISVVDQDRDRPPEFNVIVNHSADQTSFYQEVQKLNIARSAAADWAFFFGDMNLDEVPANGETIFIWARDGSNSGTRYRNTQPYRGFLLYIYGIENPNLISGGQGSWEGGLQSSGGVPFELRRSGTYQANVFGNYNRLTWFLTESDDDWLHAANLMHQTNDLYSIAHHEIGHALFFDASHPSLARFKNSGGITSSNILNYFGRAVPVDSPNHLTGQVDPASGFGAFGNEYHGVMPRYRWLITKLDLFCAEAGGYRLRETSAFAPLTLLPVPPIEFHVGQVGRHTLKAAGGVPAYHFSAAPDSLPAGLQLDSFTGEISGTPPRQGEHEIPIHLQDNTEAGRNSITNTLRIIIKEAPPRLEIQLKPDRQNLSLQLVGSSGQTTTLLASTNLHDWRDLITEIPLPFETNVVLEQQRKFFRTE